MIKDELKDILKMYKGRNIDLMLIHLGGTSIPSPDKPLLMATVDDKQRIELVSLVITIPMHYERLRRLSVSAFGIQKGRRAGWIKARGSCTWIARTKAVD